MTVQVPVEIMRMVWPLGTSHTVDGLAAIDTVSPEVALVVTVNCESPYVFAEMESSERV